MRVRSSVVVFGLITIVSCNVAAIHLESELESEHDNNNNNNNNSNNNINAPEYAPDPARDINIDPQTTPPPDLTQLEKIIPWTVVDAYPKKHQVILDKRQINAWCTVDCGNGYCCGTDQICYLENGQSKCKYPNLQELQSIISDQLISLSSLTSALSLPTYDTDYTDYSSIYNSAYYNELSSLLAYSTLFNGIFFTSSKPPSSYTSSGNQPYQTDSYKDPADGVLATKKDSSSGAWDDTDSRLKTRKRRFNTRAIVAGAVGGLIGVGLIVGLAFFIRHRKKTRPTPPPYYGGAEKPPPAYPSPPPVAGTVEMANDPSKLATQQQQHTQWTHQQQHTHSPPPPHPIAEAPGQQTWPVPSPPPPPPPPGPPVPLNDTQATYHEMDSQMYRIPN